jgi:hypothetical protein
LKGKIGADNKKENEIMRASRLFVGRSVEFVATLYNQAGLIRFAAFSVTNDTIEETTLAEG